MKKHLLYLFLAGCTLLLNACSDDDAQYLPPMELKITTSAVEFTAIGGEGTIKVANADQNLKAASNVEWCQISDCSQGVVNFVIAPHTGMETRTAVITLTMGESVQKVGITQIGYLANYETKSVFTFGGNKAFTQFIRFESEIPVTISIDEEATWLSYEEVEGGFNITGTENTETAERIGKATITSGEMVKEYQFIQYSNNTYIRSWKAAYKSTDGFAKEDDITIASAGQGVEITFKNYAITLKGSIEDGVLNVPLAQYTKTADGYRLLLGLDLGEGKVAVNPEMSFSLLPDIQENGQWALVPKPNSSIESFQSVALIGVKENMIEGIYESFGNLSMLPGSEAEPPIKTYNIAFTSATGENYGATDDLIFKNDTYEIGIETKGEKYKFLKSGTYVVNANEGFKIINNYIDYTYFKKIGEDTKLDLKSGEMVVNADLNTKKYEITMKFVLEDNSLVNATYTGEIEGEGFAIFDEITIDVATVDRLERIKPNNPVDGQFYLKIALNNWDNEMTLDLRAASEATTILPEDTYTVGNSDEPKTLHTQNSDLTYKYETKKFQSGQVKVSKKDKLYTFEVDVTDVDGQRYLVTFSGEVKNMENPQ